MIRRVGQTPRIDKTYRLRAGAYAILPLKGRFLMVAQITDEVELMLPGGGIDPESHHCRHYTGKCWRKSVGALRGPAELVHFADLSLCRSMIFGRRNCAMSTSHTPSVK